MKVRIIVLLLVASLFSACTTLRSISFERLQAADVSFPEQIRTVGVVNYMPDSSQGEKNVDYASNVLQGDGRIAAETFAQEIAATNYFDKVVICDSAMHQVDRGMPSSMSQEMVKSLLQSLEVDMLFVMEQLNIQLKEGYLYAPEIMEYVPSMDAAVTPVMKVYVANRNAPLFTVSKSDTICWEYLPSLTVNQVIKDASEYGATMPVEHLLPHWKEMHRFYYDGGFVDMRDAAVFVREQNWDAALRLWQKVYDGKKKGKAKMRAAFNMALYYEMQDDYDRALSYLEEALPWVDAESPDGSLLRFYRMQLEEQKQKNLKLKIQMKRFE